MIIALCSFPSCIEKEESRNEAPSTSDSRETYICGLPSTQKKFRVPELNLDLVGPRGKFERVEQDVVSPFWQKLSKFCQNFQKFHIFCISGCMVSVHRFEIYLNFFC